MLSGFKKLLLLCLLFFSFCSAFSQGISLSNYYVDFLGNDLKVVILPDNKSDMVSIEFCFRYDLPLAGDQSGYHLLTNQLL